MEDPMRGIDLDWICEGTRQERDDRFARLGESSSNEQITLTKRFLEMILYQEIAIDDVDEQHRGFRDFMASLKTGNPTAHPLLGMFENVPLSYVLHIIAGFRWSSEPYD